MSPEPSAHRPLLASVLCLLLAAVPLAAQNRTSPPGWVAKTNRKLDAPAVPLAQADLVQTAERLHRLLGDPGRAKPAVSDPDPGRRLSGWNLTRHERNGTPVFLSGPVPAAKAAKPAAPLSIPQSQALALDFVDTHRDLFRLERPRAELEPMETTADSTGRVHVAFQQHYQGIPLWGCDLVVHLRPDGSPYAMNARYTPTPQQAPDLVPTLDADQAIRRALYHLGASTPIRSLSPQIRQLLAYEGPTATQYLWLDPVTQRPHLVWQVEIRPTLPDRWLYFVDAHTGQILEAYNATPTQGPVTATALDLNGRQQTLNVHQTEDNFYLLDAARPSFAALGPEFIDKPLATLLDDPLGTILTLPGFAALVPELIDKPLALILDDPLGAIITLDAQHRDLSFLNRVIQISSPDNTWNDPTAVSAHYHAGRVFDYYFDTHNRLGLDGRGRTIFSIVHVTNEGRPMDNAFASGPVVAYGDGNTLFNPLAGALDITAHELTHIVIRNTVDLTYSFQSGALNESLCDLFAAMVDRDDWWMGEDAVKLSAFPSGALRDMAAPHNGFESDHPLWQPAHMDEFVQLDLKEDNGGVHINSGIPNSAAFLIAQALGRDKTERIYYRVLEARYLNRQANFVDMRLAAARAAGDLFGDGSPEVEAVLDAFDQVGIHGDGRALPAADRAPFEGEEWIAVINTESNDNSLMLVRPVIQSEQDIVQLTSTQVRSNTGSPISAAADGSILLFVDEENRIRSIRFDGSDETIVSATGDWSSIALSPDGSRLAATTVSRDSTIFIFDLADPQASKRIRLYNPTTQEGVRNYVTRFADAIDWSVDGRFLLFDALNSIPREGSRPIVFWTINLLDADSELILPLFTNQQSEGIDLANPSFAQTNDNFIVFDRIDNVAGQVEIWAADLFNGTANLIEANGSSIGYPRYSPNDDYLIFQRKEDRVPTLRQIRLEADKIRASAPSELFTRESQRPTWFGVAHSPSAVLDAGDDARPAGYRLRLNYPNPFNAATVVSYDLPHAADISLTVYDLVGQQVTVLTSGLQTAGTHAARWSGLDRQSRPVASGVYFYRLEAADPDGQRFVRTRKMTLLR